jgi:hypothetical protein
MEFLLYPPPPPLHSPCSLFSTTVHYGRLPHTEKETGRREKRGRGTSFLRFRWLVEGEEATGSVTRKEVRGHIFLLMLHIILCGSREILAFRAESLFFLFNLFAGGK